MSRNIGDHSIEEEYESESSEAAVGEDSDIELSDDDDQSGSSTDGSFEILKSRYKQTYGTGVPGQMEGWCQNLGASGIESLYYTAATNQSRI